MDFYSGKKIHIGYDRSRGYTVRLGSEAIFSNKSKERCEQWLEEQRDYEVLVKKFFTLPVPGSNPLQLVHSLKKAG